MESDNPTVEPNKPNKMMIVIGLVVASLVIAVVLNMMGMKQVHVESGKPAPAQQAPAPGGAPAGSR